MRRIIVGVSMLLLAGTVVVRAQSESTDQAILAFGMAPTALELHDAPPSRPALFPFVLVDGEVTGTIAEGEVFEVLRNEERNDFLREPARWSLVRTKAGMNGWIDSSTAVFLDSSDWTGSAYETDWSSIVFKLGSEGLVAVTPEELGEIMDEWEAIAESPTVAVAPSAEETTQEKPPTGC